MAGDRRFGGGASTVLPCLAMLSQSSCRRSLSHLFAPLLGLVLLVSAAGCDRLDVLLSTKRDDSPPPRIMVAVAESPRAGGAMNGFGFDHGSFGQLGRMPSLSGRPAITPFGARLPAIAAPHPLPGMVGGPRGPTAFGREPATWRTTSSGPGDSYSPPHFEDADRPPPFMPKPHPRMQMPAPRIPNFHMMGRPGFPGGPPLSR